MSQEQILELIRKNPGIEQTRVIRSKTSCNFIQLKALLRKGLIRREIINKKYHLYISREEI